MKCLSGLALAVVVLWSAAAAQAAPPVNDDFADAQVLGPGQPVTATGTNVEATKEVGEPEIHPDHPPFAVSSGHSVWFEWEATIAGLVTVDTCGSALNALLTVFTGAAVGELRDIGTRGGPGCEGGWQVTFTATPGTIYKIAVDGVGYPGGPSPRPTEGSFELHLRATPVPANDDFANATALSAMVPENGYYGARAEGSNWNASKEAGEPDHGGVQGGASVWYTWTPPVSGLAWMGGCREDSLVEAVYTGDALNALTPVPGRGICGLDGLRFSAVAGTTYRIAVDGELNRETQRPGMGEFSINATVVEILTRISKRKVKSRKRRQVFAFTSNYPAAEFRCRLDRGSFAPCISPMVYTRLKPGRHTFKVVAAESLGNADPTPAIDRFVILGPKKKSRPKGKRPPRR